MARGPCGCEGGPRPGPFVFVVLGTGANVVVAGDRVRGGGFVFRLVVALVVAFVGF